MTLFGMTAKQWRAQNPDAEGNIRDYTDIYQLIILVNLEIMNAELIKRISGMIFDSKKIW